MSYQQIKLYDNRYWKKCISRIKLIFIYNLFIKKILPYIKIFNYVNKYKY